MNESDDESVRSGMKSGDVSEEEWTDETNSVIRFVRILFLLSLMAIVLKSSCVPSLVVLTIHRS